MNGNGIKNQVGRSWNATLKQQAQPRAEPRELVPPDCELCNDKGFVYDGFYEQPCPACNKVCKRCANQGSFRLKKPGDPRDGQMIYCNCDVGRAMAHDVFDRKYSASKLPKGYRDCTFESFLGLINDQPAAAENKMKAYCAVSLWASNYANGCYVDWADVERLAGLAHDDSYQEPVRNWIVLHGIHGTGKTGLLAAAFNYLMLAGQSARYIRAMDAIAAVQNRFGENDDAHIPKDDFGLLTSGEVKLALKQIPILLLDEMDMPDARTDNKLALMQDMMRGRAAEVLPTGIATNLTYAELMSRWDETTVSVIGQRAHVINMGGVVLRAKPQLAER